MSKKNYFIGVDFGGTSIRAGVVDRKGQVLGFEKRKTQAELGTDVVFERLAVAIERAMRAADVKAKDIGGIGIGVPGPVDQERGVVRVQHPRSGLRALRRRAQCRGGVEGVQDGAGLVADRGQADGPRLLGGLHAHRS